MSPRFKLRFTFTNADGGNEIETLWAIPRADGYEIDNIPFYAREIALGDVVAAQTDEQGALWYSELVRPSGHSTLQLWVARQEEVESIRQALRQQGCASELSDLPRLIAVDVPPEIPYAKIKRLLDQGEQSGQFQYQEACLGFPAKREENG